jgi:3-hydroxyacyl-[acyl-carrier-protein] dehydratase
LSEDFRHSVIVLREVRNIKYGAFMEPGRQMQVTVDLVERGEGLATFKGKGEAEGQSTVSARLTLATYNLRDACPVLALSDERIVEHLRLQAAVLCHSLQDQLSSGIEAATAAGGRVADR